MKNKHRLIFGSFFKGSEQIITEKKIFPVELLFSDEKS